MFAVTSRVYLTRMEYPYFAALNQSFARFKSTIGSVGVMTESMMFERGVRCQRS